MERRVPFDLLRQCRRRGSPPRPSRQRNGRAELYEHAGKKAEAIAALEAGVKTWPEQPIRAIAGHQDIFAKIFGSPAAELTVERRYGDFNDLQQARTNLRNRSDRS